MIRGDSYRATVDVINCGSRKSRWAWLGVATQIVNEASVATGIAQFNPLCRNNNAEAVPGVAIKSPAKLPHAVITK